MNKKIIVFITLLCTLSINTPAAVVNQIIVSVGSIAITSFDIARMRDFEAIIAQKRPTSNEALEKLITLSSLLVIAENNSDYYMDEVELRKQIGTMTNNPSDPNSPQRKKLYEDYSDLYRMLIRSDKVKKGLMFGDVHVKAEINKPIPIGESKSFYNKNKAQFKDSPFPKFNLIIFAVAASDKWTLTELSEVETKMQALAKDLDTSNNFNALKKKYSSLRFTAFSGATGLFTPDILILQKKIPDEILGIALQPSLNLGGAPIPIVKNKGIFIPQPIPFRSTGVSTYLTMKILDVVQPQQLSLDIALPRVEEMIKYERAEKAIDKSIKKRIAEGEITLTPSDNSYKNVFNKFK